ncbi:hypothetical protein NR798_04540 [Archangium gephyra]|uniref:hypothetical protein n=1 Tax=Archangium gephyra TaxID=48 RepID=UPI0035D44B4E
MKIKLFTVFLVAFCSAFGATAAIDDDLIIVCSGGIYCEDERQVCLASGQSPDMCQLNWRSCVFDACPQ